MRGRGRWLLTGLFAALLLDLILGLWTDLGREEAVAAVLLDRSISMAGDPLEKAVDGIWRFLYQSEDKVPVALVVFSDRAEVLVGLTLDRAEIREGLEDLKARGRTDLSVGVRAALDLLKDRGEVRDVLFLTDGKEEGGEIPEALEEEAVSEGIRFFILGTEGREGEHLRELAERTGGTYGTLEELPETLRRIRGHQREGRRKFFLMIGGLEAVLLAGLWAVLSRRRKPVKKQENRKGTVLPNAGYLRQEEIDRLLQKK